MKSVLSVGFADDDGVVKELGEGGERDCVFISTRPCLPRDRARLYLQQTEMGHSHNPRHYIKVTRPSLLTIPAFLHPTTITTTTQLTTNPPQITMSGRGKGGKVGF